MSNLQRIVSAPLNHLPHTGGIILCGLIIAMSGLVALLSADYVILIGVLMLGLPFALLVFIPQIRPTAVVLLLIFVPFTSILKAITGSRFAPLTFDLALLLAFGLYMAHGFIRHKIRLGWLDLCFFLFLLFACLQMFNPNVPSLQAGAEGLRKFAFATILFYVGRHFFRAKDIVFWQKALIIASVAIALYGLKQFFYMSAIDYRMIELASASPITYLMGGWIRPFSTLPGPFHLGLYLMVVSLLLITQLMLKHGRATTRLIIPFILLLHLVVLFFTRTKGNWVGLFAGFIVLLFLQTRQPIKFLFTLFGLGFVSLLFIAIISAIAPANSLGVLEDAISAVTNPLEAPTFIYRVQLWEEIMVPALQENPLFGYGTSSSGEGLSNLYIGTNSKHFASHNLYLKVFLELGLVGLAIFLVLVGGSLWNAGRNLRHVYAIPSMRLTYFWGIATVMAFLVAGLVIPTLDASPVNYYFWFLLGLISSKELAQVPYTNPTTI